MRRKQCQVPFPGRQGFPRGVFQEKKGYLERVKKLATMRSCGNWCEAEWKHERKHSGHSTTIGGGKSASTGDADPGCGVTD